MRIIELWDKLKSSGDNLEEKGLIMTTLNGLPPFWESFIQTEVVEPSSPNLISYGQNALRKKQESQHAKDFMALNLGRIKRSYLMPRKAKEGEGSPSITSSKIRDQVLPRSEETREEGFMSDTVL